MDKIEELIQTYEEIAKDLRKRSKGINESHRLYAYMEGRYLMCERVIRDLKQLSDENGIS